MRRLALVLLTVVGCATTTTTASVDTTFRDQFPTRAALDNIAAAPRPTKLARDPGLAIERWQLTGPLPDAIEPLLYSDGLPWQQWLESALAQSPGAVTPASMRCVARENGRFFLTRQALPDERLSAFIAARCGVVASDATVTYLSGTTRAATSDEAMFAMARPQLEKQLKQLLEHGARQLGIWIGREQGRIVLMLSAASEEARLQHTPLVPSSDGTVTIAGVLTNQNDHVEGLINRGHFGFARCSVDPTVPLPQFVVRCPADTTDATAWVEVAAFPPGRVMGRVVARLLLFPSGAPSAAYEQAEYVHRSLPAGPEPRRQLLELLNGVRTEAGLPPVTLAERESAVAEQVAPHYFAALAGTEPELVADQIMLGLRAGWEVEGDLCRGDFAYGLIAKSDDLGRLLDTVLERPAGRETLLARTADSVALGPLIATDQQLVGVVAGSYQLMRPGNPSLDAQRLMGRLTKARVDARMPPVRVERGLDSYAAEAVARVQRGALSPRAALKDMLERAVQWRRGVLLRGWVVEASTIEDLTFPVELLRVRLAGVGVSIGHYRPTGAPWSRLLIFLIAQSADDGVSAARATTTF